MSSKKSSGFGAPKPLPGQAAYGVTEAQMLERQAEEMELRLKMLQTRMQEAEASEPAVGSGGTRWRSARPDKGGVTTYAKDVKDRQQRKAAERNIVATAEGTTATAISAATTATTASASATKRDPTSTRATAGSATAVPPQSKGARPSNALADWTVSDVCEWLASKGLGQYAETFEANQIVGAVLTDLSLEDFDYMGITALGHRKILLKGIDELSQMKASKKPSKTSASASSAASAAEVAEPYSRTTGSSTVHWSQLEPIANNKVSAPSASVNAADGDVLDEEAERRAFTEAVMEWRRMGKAESSGSSNQLSSGINNSHSSGSSSNTGGGGMWANPFDNPGTGSGALGGVGEEEGGQQWASAGASSGGVMKGGGGGSLLDGTYDEEKERREFAAAVAAWRSAGKTTSDSTSSSTGAKPQHQAAESTGTGTGTGTSAAAVVSASSVADRISKAMEEEHKRMVQRIQEEQEAALRRLQEASRDLEALKRKKDEEGLDVISPTVVAAEAPHVVITTHIDDGDDGEDNLSAASEMILHDDDAAEDGHEESKVLVELVESRLEATASLQGDDEECGYFVEEASDEDV